MDEKILARFLEELEKHVFIKSTNSFSGEEKNLFPKIADLEGTVVIDGEWDKEDFLKILSSTYESGREAGKKEAQDEK